jgi:putative membrane protein
MPLKIPYFPQSLALLISIYFAGLWGINSPLANEILQKYTPFEHFASLTPLNLILTAFLLFIFQKPRNKTLYLWMFLVMTTGFLVEVLGVHTGMIFGNYEYGEVLGWKLWQVPLMIGVNWWILMHCACQITYHWTNSKFLQVITPPFLMTFTDILIEPVAIHLKFWIWQNDIVPFQNYVAWFIVSFLLSMIYNKYFSNKNFFEYNPMSFPILMAQILFFGIHNFLI